MSDLLGGLNTQQRDAVTSVNGPVLALAGAGTGKTHVLITRIAYLVHEGLVDPSEVLAVTFTNKAAAEMKRRLETICPGYSFPWCGTFHSMAVRILRGHIDALGFDKSFSIIDMDDQVRTLEELVDTHAPGSYESGKKREFARSVSEKIQRWKDKGLWPHHVTDELLSDGGSRVTNRLERLVQRIYPLYQDRLAQMKLLDYGDILLFCVRLFHESPETLLFYKNLFKYICVDEYQDTNSIQDQWVRMMVGKEENIFCVGDDDQSIYRWRGAEIGNILSFSERYPSAKIIRLEENYRSTKPILSAAAKVISRNSQRIGKTLWTSQEGGDPVCVRGFWGARQEASWIGMRILRLKRQEVSLDRIAILLRSNYLTRTYEDALAQYGISYRVVGGMRFYDRMEIKDIMAYLRLVAHGGDDLAFVRCCNTPKRGVGPSKVEKIRERALASATNYFQSTQDLLKEGFFKGEAARSLQQFLNLLEQWRAQLLTEKLSVVIQNIITQSGYQAMCEADTSPNGRARLDNLSELAVAAEEFSSLTDFLAHVSLMSSADVEDKDAETMSIMTIHAAKGLEFDACFLAAWEQDVFPSRRAEQSRDMVALEEERRLAYVAITRARKELCITFVQGQGVAFNRGKGPSLFLRELPMAELDFSSTSD